MKKMYYVVPTGTDCDGYYPKYGYCFYSKRVADNCANDLCEGSDGIGYYVTTDAPSDISFVWGGIYIS